MTRALLAALALAAVTAPPALADQPVAAEAKSAVSQITAKVNGMVCDFCAQAVISVFGKHDAVEKVDVDLDDGEIRIDIKDGGEISDARIEDLVTQSGYDLVEIIRPGA